jgi:hypothetical protein
MGHRLLSLCGVFSAVLFISTTILGGALRPGFSHISETISELFSPGSPNKLLLDTLHTVSAILGTLFGYGVLLFVRGSGRSETIGIVGAVLVIATGLVNIATATVFPQDAFASPATFPGQMHMILAGVLALLSMSATLLLGIWLQRTGMFPGFGTYSLITFAIVLLTGGFAVANVGTSIMGLTERITIAAGMQWTITLSLKMYVSGA